jgi:V/A-type H+-transporting ATPase subunit E
LWQLKITLNWISNSSFQAHPIDNSITFAVRVEKLLINDMNSTLQDLTEKIYLEGVEKGKTEADSIVAKASEEAAALLQKAEADAAAIVAQAKKQAEELDKNTRSELTLFARQAVEALKTETTNLINGRITTDAIAVAISDKDFMQKVILAFAQEWAKKEAIVIETKEAEELTAFFNAKAKELLDKKVTIKSVNGIPTDFTIQPAGGGYKISFGEAEFIEYFKEFLRPKLVELLF